MVSGCGSPTPRSSLYQQLQDEDPSVRIQAIHHAGQAKDPQAVPYLVDRLSDSDSDVRFFAIVALQKITGQTMGYDFYAPSPQRDAAIQRWRQWLQEGRPALPPDRHSMAATAPAPQTATDAAGAHP